MSSNILTLLTLLFGLQVYSQKIISREGNAPVAYAHILLDHKIYTYSDDKGEFSIATKQLFDTITISHLSYKTLSLSRADFIKNNIIIVDEKQNELKEVSITVSKKKKKAETLLPEKSLRDKLYSKDNHRLVIETVPDSRKEGAAPDAILISKAVYVPNEKQIENAVIKKIILTSNPKKKQDNEPYAPFKVNLMTFDTITKLPGEKIFAEDLAVGKRRGETVIIDLSREDLITFPKEGICVVVSVYDTMYYLNMGNLTPPAFKPALIPKSSAFREYTFGLLGDYWEEASYSIERTQCFDFGIEIEYFK